MHGDVCPSQKRTAAAARKRSAEGVRVGLGLFPLAAVRRWLQNKDLDGEVGIDVVVADERSHASPAEFLDDAGRLRCHAFLVRAADAQDSVGPTVLDQALLTPVRASPSHTRSGPG